MIATILLWALALLAAVATFGVATIVSQLGRSDPAGNGMAQAWLVIALLVTWVLLGALLLAGCLRTPDPALAALLPSGGATWALFVVALLAQLASLPVLFDGGAPAALRTALQVGVAATPAAVLLHAAWRTLALPLPVGVVVHGCAAIVLVGAALGALAFAHAAFGGRTRQLPVEHRPTYPALLLDGDRAVHVLRGAEDLGPLLRAGESRDGRVVVDAGAVQWRVRVPEPAAGAAGLDLERGDVLDFGELVARLLRIPQLAATPAEDVRVRELIAMQSDVTALTFVLPR